MTRRTVADRCDESGDLIWREAGGGVVMVTTEQVLDEP